MSTSPLTRRELDAQVCGNPACTHEAHDELFLSPGCHPGGGVTVSYHKDTGVLTIRCHHCERFITSIGVAAQPRAWNT